MTTFVLLHGAFHGGWCWGPTITALEGAGHRATAPDLPIDDLDAGWPEHRAAALAAFPDGDDPITVVAHSRAGRLVPLLVDDPRVERVILLSAAMVGGLVPPPYRTDPYPTVRTPPRPGGTITDDLGRTVLLPDRAREDLFHDCPPEVAQWAIAQLRPQVDLPPPPERQWPAIAVIYLACRDDRVVDLEWMRAASRERYGADPLEIAGGHSPFLADPQAFAELLGSLV